MKKIHHEILINAPREKVWHTMLDKGTYEQWTNVFDADSHYEGSWEKGQEIRFTSSTGDGMFAVIADNKPYEFVSIQHLGIIKNGVKETESTEAKQWSSIFENYSFTDKDGMTLVSVDMDIEENYEEMFNEMWPKALEKLKEISEK